VASWFETRGLAAFLTMRVQDLSKDEATELENAPEGPAFFTIAAFPIASKTLYGAASALPLAKSDHR
jgi:hypothetical protein